MSFSPLSSLRGAWQLLAHLFYPRLCLACQRQQPPGQDIICVACRYRLPKTNFHTVADNPMAERLWGRVPIQQASAYLYYDRGGQVQRLIYQLKYERRPDVGEALGRLYAAELLASEGWTRPDVIVPVPLHPRKLHERGYNQAAAIGRGLKEVFDIPQWEDGLRRKTYAKSQTRKSRLERMANVSEAFTLGRPAAQFEHKHILLVDDVFTTGATLEACALPLLEVTGVRVSLVTLAVAVI